MRNIYICILLLPAVLAIICGCASQKKDAKVRDLVHEQETQNEESYEEITPAYTGTDSTAPPLADITEEPQEAPMLRFVVISDMNGVYGSAEYDTDVQDAVAKIIAERPDIVINTGDMVAGQKPKLNYRRMWEGFHEAVTNPIRDANIPMAQVPGNHDASAYEAYAGEREIYIDEWTQRRPTLDFVDDSAYPLYYSFTYKGIFFVALDATTLEPLDDAQYAWLETQLKNNPTAHGAVVFMHVPLFPITTIKPTEILRDARLPGLFNKYHVQMVCSGHQQAYFPARYENVTYLLAGALGGGPRPVRQNDGVSPKTLTFVSLYANHDPYIQTLVKSGASGEWKQFNHNILPTYLMFGSQILPRVDIKAEDASFARDYMISPHMTKPQMTALIESLRATGGDWGKIPDWSDHGDNP